MMHLFINFLAASAGGGLTYIRNVLPLMAGQSEVQLTVAIPTGLRSEFSELRSVNFIEVNLPAVRRFWYEQSKLPSVVQRSGCDVLLSAGNFAIRESPVPQILLSRNSIYTSKDFYADLLARREYRAWIDTHARGLLAKKSVQWADVTVAPSEAFAEDLRQWTGAQVAAIHHGFDAAAFNSDAAPLPEEVERKLSAAEGTFTLLFVSHYNYYRNFETLFRALPILRRKLNGRLFRLLLTCKLQPGQNPGEYQSDAAARLIEKLEIGDLVVELGSVPYRQLHHVYRRADIYVTPAYTETFAHPLVEAMASGVPVVASDLAVHREICGDAGVYFSRFSPEDLATSVERVARSGEISRSMAQAGLKRSQDFSWKRHVKEILELAGSLADSKGKRH